jgi:3-deoxy-manno-octulosonate cytidylyltransferase (CMP-KDO synthetase)
VLSREPVHIYKDARFLVVAPRRRDRETPPMPTARPSPLVLIPARLAATRLPGKPLADVCGVPMIVQVWRRAREADIGPVAVATDDATIFAAVKDHGGEAVMTRADHPSGSDRIFEALGRLDAQGRHDAIVNVQGDLPTIDPAAIRAAVRPLADPAVDVATLAAEIVREEERTNPNVVKVVGSPIGETRLRALYFTRATAPWGEGPLFHHIGLYAYRRAALERFVGLAPSPLERREKLEQLRALEAGMRIDVEIVATVPLGVDTPDDLERARAILSAGNGDHSAKDPS